MIFFRNNINEKQPHSEVPIKKYVLGNKNCFIYNHTCSHVIKDCLNGISFCFISHGETISDKLMTLIGDITIENNEDKYKGIFPRVLSELFNI